MYINYYVYILIYESFFKKRQSSFYFNFTNLLNIVYTNISNINLYITAYMNIIWFIYITVLNVLYNIFQRQKHKCKTATFS